jgi:hypothetical protein
VADGAAETGVRGHASHLRRSPRTTNDRV